MGLDTSHGCWGGPYTAFMRWRQKVAEAAGIPLMLMEGFFQPNDLLIGALVSHIAQEDLAKSQWDHEIMRWLPVKWESLKPDPLHVLLNHSDADGAIAAADCGPVADRLEALLPRLDGDGGGSLGDYRAAAERFIRGLRAAAAVGEAVEFH